MALFQRGSRQESTPPAIHLSDGSAIALEIIRHRQAKVMRLRFDAGRGVARLTVPPRASLSKARLWAQTQHEWLARQVARQPEPVRLGPDASFPLEGVATPILWRAEGRRVVSLTDEALVVSGGDPALVGARVFRWLRARALATLEAETRTYAARIDARVTRVSVGDPRSRWGSCSSNGAIRYSWRLILAPPAVRQSVVAHEVAHLVHMHHGPAFHDLVAELLGRRPDAESAWLRAFHVKLHAIRA